MAAQGGEGFGPPEVKAEYCLVHFFAFSLLFVLAALLSFNHTHTILFFDSRLINLNALQLHSIYHTFIHSYTYFSLCIDTPTPSFKHLGINLFALSCQSEDVANTIFSDAGVFFKVVRSCSSRPNYFYPVK